MGSRRLLSSLLVVLAGCPADDGGSGGSGAATTTATTGSMDSGDSTDAGSDSSTTADPCADVELVLCDFCPESMATLCGLPCETEGQTCSNEIGDGMQCTDGQWACAVHPPLDEGCNLVCQGAEACTEIGCTDGLTVALRPDADGITPGSYAVTIEADGEAESCALVISDDPADCDAGPPCVPQSDCNALNLLTDAEPHIAILLDVAADLSVNVQRDDAPVVEVAAQPVYDVQSPNGSGCIPACAFGEVDVEAL